jgi:DNA invertase Pin-like site-specific DNA recombinase
MMQKKEIGCLIVAKLDRMTRSIKDLAELVEIATKKDVALISVNEHIDTGTAAGRMILNMLGVISQWERETIGERTSSALQYKKQSGKVYNCNALYGYENQSGNLIPVESEREIIALIVHFRDQHYSYKAISEKLNAMGKLSRSGKWYSEQVRRVILHSADRKSIMPKIEFATT